MAWSVETLNETVDAELEALPTDMRARFEYITRLIEDWSGSASRTSNIYRESFGRCA